MVAPKPDEATLVRHSYELQLRRAEDDVARDGTDVNVAAPEETTAIRVTVPEIEGRDLDAAPVRAALEAQRRRLVALRAAGTIGDAAFQRVEAELDWMELGWAQLLRTVERADGQA
jgi:monovalent cation/hydrogen antiporter